MKKLFPAIATICVGILLWINYKAIKDKVNPNTIPVDANTLHNGTHNFNGDGTSPNIPIDMSKTKVPHILVRDGNNPLGPDHNALKKYPNRQWSFYNGEWVIFSDNNNENF